MQNETFDRLDKEFNDIVVTKFEKVKERFEEGMELVETYLKRGYRDKREYRDKHQ